jgi:hypothetical protein
MRTFRAPGAAPAAASAAARAPATATKAAGTATAPPPPPPRRSAGAGTPVARTGAKKKPAPEVVEGEDDVITPQIERADTGVDLRAEHAKAKEAEGSRSAWYAGGDAPSWMKYGYGALGAGLALPVMGAVPEIYRAVGDKVAGPANYDRLRATVQSYVPEMLGGGLSRGAVEKVIAGVPVAVYPRDVQRDVATTARTPAEFKSKRDQLRAAFAAAQREYRGAADNARRNYENEALPQESLRAGALNARERLQRVVDLRETLRNMGEPEESLVIE